LKTNEQITYIKNGSLDTLFKELYKNEPMTEIQSRFTKLITTFTKLFGEQDVQLFSAPGRTELGGNHTDHNHGKVLAASIQHDAIAVVSPNSSTLVEIYSEGYDKIFTINVSSLEPIADEKETTTALIRGVAHGILQKSGMIGGFQAVIHSRVLGGSGLSSSAAFEVLIGTIFNHLYCNGSLSAVAIAKIGQNAENNYFGKPCGLMDQTACAYGQMISIDFENVENPVIDPIYISFQDYGYSLLVIDTGGNHADLTEDYASIPREMKMVASFFSKESCRDINKEDIIQNINQIREQCGDRAVLRTLHFFNENNRVDKMLHACQKGSFNDYLKYVNESGRSSFQYLQNIYATQNPHEQKVSLALALTDDYLNGQGAFRIQGGGFAGTIQAYVPVSQKSLYTAFMEQIFGVGCITELYIRPMGAIEITKNQKEKL
jgi:galactokinase